MRRSVLGILAHVDSGKTSLSEAMLYRAGELRRLGRVDHGDAFLDTDALEKQRGITIFSKQAELRLQNIELTLLDTPGHVDFSAEMERTLQVLDCAILVISGTDGVQSHTRTLWHLLERYHIPVFLFINKMDLPGVDRNKLLAQLQQELSAGCLPLERQQDGSPTPQTKDGLALLDEEMMEAYLTDSQPDWDAFICRAIRRRQLFPCFFGSALKCEGVDALLDGLEIYSPCPEYGESFAARVFKITQDDQGNRLTYMKITGGSLSVRQPVDGVDTTGPWQEKVRAIRIYNGAKYRAVEQALPGTVCAVAGLTHTKPGCGLGTGADALTPVMEPVLTYRVLPPDGVDLHTALVILREIEQQEPALRVVCQPELNELRIQVMGEVQLEVLTHLMQQRGLNATFGHGSILYRETISRAVEGVGHYEPLRHYAEVHLLLEPGAPGSRLVFETGCSTDDLALNWQRLVLTHLEEKTHRGVLIGAPITDMKITLLAGRAHPKHTEGGDFRQATYRALRQGLRGTESVLLEPFYEFRLSVPADCIGRAMLDMERAGATVNPPLTTPEGALLTGSAPVATLREYHNELRSYTKGLGSLTLSPAGYRPCHNTAEVIAANGYDPDSDLDNTADSVFCAHGAGFTVRWNEVRRYMHIDSGWGKRAVQSLQTAEGAAALSRHRENAARYRGTLEEDRELLAIFERTYGPIRRKTDNIFRPSREVMHSEKTSETPAKTVLPTPSPNGGDYLLVDGYNILFAWEDLHALAAEDLAAARSRLADILANYHGWHGGELILVYDAYRVKGGEGEVIPYHGIHIVYTKEAETADMYIEKVTHKLQKNGANIRVATSDGLEQLIILGHGALRVSATAFRAEVDAVLQEIRECLE